MSQYAALAGRRATPELKPRAELSTTVSSWRRAPPRGGKGGGPAPARRGLEGRAVVAGSGHGRVKSREGSGVGAGQRACLRPPRPRAAGGEVKRTGPGWGLLSGNCSLSATQTSVSLALLGISPASVSDSSQGCGFSFLRPSYECCWDVQQRSRLPWLQTASLCSGPKALECTGVGTLISAACSVQEDLTPTFEIPTQDSERIWGRPVS